MDNEGCQVLPMLTSIPFEKFILNIFFSATMDTVYAAIPSNSGTTFPAAVAQLLLTVSKSPPRRHIGHDPMHLCNLFHALIGVLNLQFSDNSPHVRQTQFAVQGGKSTVQLTHPTWPTAPLGVPQK